MLLRRRLLRVGIGIAIVFTLLGVPVMAQESGQEPQVHITQVDTSRFPKVTVYVSVTDAQGEPVGIDPARLLVEENGQLIQPDQIEGTAATVDTLTTMLVMDISGSMDTADKLNTAKSAARAFGDQMRSGDQTGLVSFNTEVSYTQPITSDKGRLMAAIDSLVAIHDTAMYDALIEAIDLLAPFQGRKAIIVLTDGMDNRSTSGLADVISNIGPSGLTISTVGLGNPEIMLASIAGIDEPALKTLATEAGGEYAYASDAQGLTQLYQHYARVLQSEYAITYNSPGELRDGLTRYLSIRLDEAGSASPAGSYNPGGLVPEVGEPASWSFFLTALGLLILAVFVPGIIRFAGSLSMPRNLFSPKKRKPRIHFTDKMG
jgi:VWFA-related protein